MSSNTLPRTWKFVIKTLDIYVVSAVGTIEGRESERTAFLLPHLPQRISPFVTKGNRIPIPPSHVHVRISRLTLTWLSLSQCLTWQKPQLKLLLRIQSFGKKYFVFSGGKRTERVYLYRRNKLLSLLFYFWSQIKAYQARERTGVTVKVVAMSWLTRDTTAAPCSWPADDTAGPCSWPPT